MTRLLVLPCLLLAGCAQLLGLDNTTFESNDAPVDTPNLCDATPETCVASTGRTACGSVFGSGPTAGQRFTVATPTGGACSGTEGPCGLTVTGLPLQSLFDGSGTGEVAGTIDDCGRFVVPDVDVALGRHMAVRIIDATSTFHPTATIVVDRAGDPVAGQVDRDVPAIAVLETTTVDWATQLGIGPENTTSGYLVKYIEFGTGLDLAGEGVAVNLGSPLDSPPGTIPWAAYFSDAAFGTLDANLDVTTQSGTAFAAPPAGEFSLEGFRMGRRCAIPDLQTVGNTLIHVVEVDC